VLAAGAWASRHFAVSARTRGDRERMTGRRDGDDRDTDRPPPGVDAYSAETVVRQVPKDVLEAARKGAMERAAAKKAARAAEQPSPILKAPSPAPLGPAEELPFVDAVPDDVSDDEATLLLRPRDAAALAPPIVSHGAAPASG